MAGYQNDLLETHCAEVQNIYTQMRGWRHDYHNHLQTLKGLLSLGRCGEAESYLRQLESDLQSVDTILKTGNLMLDAILNSKLSLAEKGEVAIRAKASVPPSLTVADVDLCVIIGNLLDNALESCRQLPDKGERFLRIYVGRVKEQLYISVQNAVAGRADRRGGGYRSAKGEGHGFGLRRVDALVAQYGGIVNRQDEPGVFATEIFLPL
nr:GHKL domain-containing protein [Acetanaerobacterium sp. MSJ-12]